MEKVKKTTIFAAFVSTTSSPRQSLDLPHREKKD
jgi:hypothetical protein